MRFDIITIFPEIFKSFADEALIARARQKKIISLRPHNLRDWTIDRHKTVDDRPYGGGAGMVLMAEPILKAVKALRISNFSPFGGSPAGRQFPISKKNQKKTSVVLFSAKGKKFDQATARRWAKLDQLVLICGRYEGVDERIARYVADEEISIGDYVLFGGEVPAMVVVEAVTLLLPGAVGKQKSLEDESFNQVHPVRELARGIKPRVRMGKMLAVSSHGAFSNGVKGVEKRQMQGLLEYPHYTRPEKIVISGKTRSVPKALLTGDHAKVEAWRRAQSAVITRKVRPDLFRN